jgi:tRNA threonylcarbamoyladenosine biosynthesis protein TsaE
MAKIITRSPEETKNIAAKLAAILPRPLVLALNGDLGAGKTTFIQGFCRALNVHDVVNSPTFALMNNYQGEFPVYHLDFYRLNDEFEIEMLGIDEYLPPQDGFTLIEWAEKAPHLMPEEHVSLELKNLGDDSREIIVKVNNPTDPSLPEKIEEVFKKDLSEDPI